MGMRRVQVAAAAALAAGVLAASSGCVGLTAQLLYFWKGDRAPAEFAGLEGKRVAVVCVSDASAYGPGALPSLVAQRVGEILQQRVPEIEVVGQDEVADWIDRNDWNQVDYRDIGRGVRADMVVAVDLASLSLHDGQTLLKGRAAVKTTVYDMLQGGKPVFVSGPASFVFPRHAAVHAADMSEAQFRRLFIQVLAQDVARHFHEYELKELFGGDAAALGG